MVELECEVWFRIVRHPTSGLDELKGLIFHFVLTDPLPRVWSVRSELVSWAGVALIPVKQYLHACIG